MIEIKNISKSYKNRLILDDISLSFHEEDIVVIVGRNGAGKSTLLSILAGFVKADKGTASINKKEVGFIPQADSLFEDLTVKDNINFWANISNTKNSHDLIKLFGIDEYLKKKVRELSGGMKKRVAICTALLHDPKIIIMDEPFSGLDMFYKNELLQMIAKLKEMGKCIIYTSHNTDEIFALESKHYVISNKKVYPIESKEELYEKYILA